MSDGQTIGSMASTITSNFDSLTKLIAGGSYLAGLGFSTAAILKFKSQKDNPTQIPIGTSAALVAVSAALMYLPSVMTVAGSTSFGSEIGAGASIAGLTSSDVKTAATDAGITSSDVSAAESAAKEKLSG